MYACDQASTLAIASIKLGDSLERSGWPVIWVHGDNIYQIVHNTARQSSLHDHEQFVGCSRLLSLAEVVQNHRPAVSYWEGGLAHDTPNDGGGSCLLKDICM